MQETSHGKSHAASHHKAHAAGAHTAHLSHVMSPQMLLTVFGLLLLLTALTVGLAMVPLGAWEIWISLGIATVKAGLVALYFMHLRYDAPLNGAIFVFSLVFVALFLGFTLMDANEYFPDVLPLPAAGTNVP
jgi:cytochrome c oxidase subunit IV